MKIIYDRENSTAQIEFDEKEPHIMMDVIEGRLCLELLNCNGVELKEESLWTEV